MTERPRRRRRERATSTTLDVVCCLLLVSAAVGVLAATSPPPEGHDARTADRAVALLSTTTTTVDAPGERRVHGTLAALLAHAAVADFAVDATGTTETAGGLESAIANRTRTALAGVDASVNVTASYAPLPGSEASGEATVGPAVPRDVDVSVARIRVPVGTGPAPGEIRSGVTEDGVRGLARTVADATVATVLPPSRTRWTLRDPATRSTVVSRYRTLGRALGVETTGALAGGRVQRANALLAGALADRYVAAVRSRYETPAAAAAAARPRTVVVTVRTWSP
ncbi:DUF7284 family protein [Halorubellus salinus]|uniref:DUF7284 family protein n=1 Tax=Halorubellus salinus TaxID=755309 RepID=UPI001D0784A4|nr:hypothetical protein [Halorubellus salinus]